MTRQNLFLTLILFFVGFQSNAENTQNSTPIEIEITKTKREERPRTPDYGNDITAFYQSGVVYLQFAYDMGEVEITVTNETTGEMWQQTDDSAFGYATIATSTNVGNYYITIVTDDASCYSGCYSL